MSCLIETIGETQPEYKRMLGEISKATTLCRLVMAAWQLARVLAVKIVEETLAKRANEKTQWGKCEECGRRLQSKGMVGRQIKSRVGIIKWKRRVGRCPNKCRIGQVAPLDEALGIVPNQRSTRELQQIGCLVAIFVPFETAALLVSQLSGVNVCGQTIWEWVQAAGQRIMQQLESELMAMERGIEPNPEELSATEAAQTLLMGADGVMVPFRPKAKSARGKTKWREVKIAIFARLQTGRTRAGNAITRLHRHRVVAVLGNIDQLSSRMWLEALKQGIHSAPQVVWLSDGARGFWRLFDERFKSHAVGVLDFYHAAQNIWAATKVWLDGRTQTAKSWFSAARHRLRHSPPDAVLDDIQAALLLDDLPDSASHALSKLYRYLDKHREHIDYAHLKELGLPIGSGFVESTCKWLIQQRFKGVGMRWSEDGFNHLLHLRIALVNCRFDAFFDPLLPSPSC